jgi:hypothetical protein
LQLGVRRRFGASDRYRLIVGQGHNERMRGRA